MYLGVLYCFKILHDWWECGMRGRDGKGKWWDKEKRIQQQVCAKVRSPAQTWPDQLRFIHGSLRVVHWRLYIESRVSGIEHWYPNSSLRPCVLLPSPIALRLLAPSLRYHRLPIAVGLVLESSEASAIVLGLITSATFHNSTIPWDCTASLFKAMYELSLGLSESTCLQAYGNYQNVYHRRYYTKWCDIAC